MLLWCEHTHCPPLPVSLSRWSNPMVGPPGKVNPRFHLINNNNKCDSGNKTRRQWAAVGCCPRCLNVYIGLLNHILSYVFWVFTISPCSIRLPWALVRGVWTQASSSMFLSLPSPEHLVPSHTLFTPHSISRPSFLQKVPWLFWPRTISSSSKFLDWK